MKTLASFNAPIDAQLLKSHLEGSGIAAFLRDENMVTLDWLASNAVGGVKVDVADEDYERAVEILNNSQTAEITDTPSMKYPKSPYEKIGELVYFARMLDKIRLFAAGELPAEYHANLGKGFDGRFCRYFHVEYAAVVERVKAGGSDSEILSWCQTVGKKPNEDEILAWNAFMTKRGWNDEASPNLEQQKQRSGLGDRKDIQTLFEYFEVDEKRKP